MSIQAIFELLNSENDEVVQEIGFHLAQKIKDLSVLIMPEARPSVWESCALILSEKTDSELEPYLIPLLGWLKDLNWPGAITIHDRLKNYSNERSLKKAIAVCKTKAELSKNIKWLSNLKEIWTGPEK